MGKQTSIDRIVPDSLVEAPPKPELERKFLVDSLPANFEGWPVRTEINQGYFKRDDVSYRVRLSEAGGVPTFTLSLRDGHGEDRMEAEQDISGSEFLAFWQETTGRQIAKTRFELPIDGGVIHLDRYHGRLEGAYTVEVEFEGIDAFREFEPPDWFGDEVTGGVYSNRKLSKWDRPPSELVVDATRTRLSLAASG